MVSGLIRRLSRRGRRAARAPVSVGLNTVSAEGPTRYFVHVPKTGGMAVHTYLQGCTLAAGGTPRLFEGYFVKDLVADLGAARSCTHFSGHFLGFLDPLLARPTCKATVLRDPVERAISHYLHVRRDRSLRSHAEFRSMTLGQVLADRSLRSFAVNVQARYLAALADDPGWFDHTMQVRSAPSCDQELLDRARAGLAMIEVVGLHERLPEFLSRLAAAWSLCPPPEIPRVNVASNRTDLRIHASDRERLHELNRVDAILCDEVAARLGARDADGRAAR